MRVLYLAGSGRSGSTLVTTLLGQVDGFLAAGELRYLWQRGLVDERPCGCGRPIPVCPLWGAVAATLPPGAAPRVAASLRSRLRIRRLPAVLRGTLRPHEDDATLVALYEAIAKHADDPVIVDSSKLPPYGALLAGLPGIDLRVLHVVRDPRATAYSWRRRRALDGGRDDRLMGRPPVWKAAALWLVWNATTLRLWGRTAPEGYLRVRYEDLIREPEPVLRRIAHFAWAPEDAVLPPVVDGRVHLRTTHSVAGNPSRHRTGAVPLVLDDEWRTGLPGWARWTVAAITWPLLLRFGYTGGVGR
jgi:hypothetical protein